MSSAICFSLDLSKTLSSGNVLTPYRMKKTLSLLKLKASADEKLNVTQNIKLSFVE